MSHTLTREMERGRGREGGREGGRERGRREGGREGGRERGRREGGREISINFCHQHKEKLTHTVTASRCIHSMYINIFYK